MDPAIGASTCALGSQRCAPYKGIFTRKAIRHPAHQTLSLQDVRRRGLPNWRVRSERVPASFWSRRRATRRGREPASV